VLLYPSPVKTALTLISGICWTAVYVDGIRVGLKDKSWAIPFYALALNVSWELIYTIYGFRHDVSLQTYINAVWFLFDIGILYTYFKYGSRESDGAGWALGFTGWSVLILTISFAVEYGFLREFGAEMGAGYSAFLQNLLMSVLFIEMLLRRGSAKGQSLLIAISKWIGTLAPAILYGILGDGGFPNGDYLIVVLGGMCSVFDLIYIGMLSRRRFAPPLLSS